MDMGAATRNVKLHRDAYQPRGKSSSLDFGGIRSGGPSPPWYSPKATDYNVMFADLELALHIVSTTPARTDFVRLVWIGEMFSCKHGVMVRQVSDNQWFLPLRCEHGSCVLAWPVQCFTPSSAPGLVCFNLQRCSGPALLVIESLCGWEAMEFKVRSPAWQQRNFGDAVGSLPPDCLRLVGMGAAAPILKVAAQAGFWALGKAWVETLGGFLGQPVESGSSAYETLYSLTKSALPEASEEKLLHCMERRLVKLQHVAEKSDAGLSEAPDIEDFLERRDENQVQQEGKAYQDDAANLKEFREAYRQQVARVRPVPERGVHKRRRSPVAASTLGTCRGRASTAKKKLARQKARSSGAT